MARREQSSGPSKKPERSTTKPGCASGFRAKDLKKARERRETQKGWNLLKLPPYFRKKLVKAARRMEVTPMHLVSLLVMAGIRDLEQEMSGL